MVKTENYISFIEELSLLIQYEKNEQEKLQIELKNNFSVLCEELHSLYKREKTVVYYEYIYPFINTYSFLREKSFLSVTEKLDKETYHSLYLKYLWSNRTELGNAALLNFLKEIGIKGDWLNTIQLKKYGVQEEYYTGKHRNNDLSQKWIDLFFVDDENQWLLVIENKVNSNVRYFDKEYKRSQLDNYHDYCESNSAYRNYDKTYILLSYNEKNRNYLRGKWVYADYYQLFKSLFPLRFQDALLKDYLKALFSLLFSEIQWDDNFEDTSLYRYMLLYNNVISKIQ